MDYQKQYLAALEIARRLMDTGKITKESAIEMFSELKETEDEAMMRKIKIALLSLDDAYWSTHGTTAKECIEWIESHLDKPQDLGGDEPYIKAILICLRKGNENETVLSRWFHSFLRRKCYVPDELQIKTLEDVCLGEKVIVTGGTTQDILLELLDDLKSLK